MNGLTHISENGLFAIVGELGQPGERPATVAKFDFDTLSYQTIGRLPELLSYMPIAIQEDTETLFLGNEKEIQVWSLSPLKVEKKIALPSHITQLRIDHERGKILMTTDSATLQVRDLKTLSLEREIKVENVDGLALQELSPDSGLAVIVTEKGTGPDNDDVGIHLVDLHTGKRDLVSKMKNWIGAVDFTDDGSVFATAGGKTHEGGGDNAIYVWRTKDRKLLKKLEGHTEIACSLVREVGR